MVSSSVLSLGYFVSCMFASCLCGFPTISQNMLVLWIGYSKLPLVVNECEFVYVWCLAMAWCPIQGDFLSYT